MTILFKDTFRGSGSVGGHVPDFSVVPGSWEIPAYGSGFEGGILTPDGLSGADLGGYGYNGTISLFKSPGCVTGTMGTTSNGVTAPDRIVPGGLVVNWKWMPIVPSTDDKFAYDGPLSIQVGAALEVDEFQAYGNQPVTLRSRYFGGDSAELAASSGSFVANQVYEGSLTVIDGLQILQFLGETITTNIAALGPIDWDGISINIAAGGYLQELSISTYLTSTAAWTGFRNAYEAS